MSSFLNITLDTTSPLVDVFAPEYAPIGSYMEVEIIANEDLDIYQDIYLICNNKKIPLTFLQKNNKLKGVVSLHGFTEGTLYLYVQVRDIVHNVSNRVVKTINLVENKGLLLSDKIYLQNISNNIQILQQNNKFVCFDMVTIQKNQGCVTSEIVMKHFCKNIKLK